MLRISSAEEFNMTNQAAISAASQDLDVMPSMLSDRSTLITSPAKIIEELRTLPADQVYETAKLYLHEICEKGQAFLDTVAIELYIFVKNGEFWKGHETQEGFEDSWTVAREAIDRREYDKNYIQQVMYAALQAWNGDAEKIMIRVRTKTFAEKVSKLVRSGIGFEEMQLRVNNAILQRLEKGMHGRGIRRAKEVMQGDLDNAYKSPDLTELTLERLSKHHLSIDEDGFVCEYHRMPRILDEADKDQSIALDEDESQISSAEEIQSQNQDPEGSRISSAEEIQSRKRNSEMSGNDDSDDEQSQNSELPTEPAAKKPKISQNPSDSAPCGCKMDASRLAKAIPKTKLDVESEREALIIFRLVGRSIRKNATEISPDSICKEHAARLAHLLHIYTNGVDYETLVQRLRCLHTRLGDWDDAKKEFEVWFKPSSGKDLGSCFRFHPKIQPPLVSNFEKLQHLTFQDVSFRCFGRVPPNFGKKIERDWSVDGSVVVPIFSWLRDDWDGCHPRGLMDMIEEEFNMYDWHYQSRKHAPRVGWAKNAWYSGIQQLVRRDYAYYMFYVLLRPDHQYRLVSFPYYAKSAYPGEQTAFRHLDINVTDLLASQRMANAIQGTVSLTDEDPRNCTEMLLGMQRHLAEWWRDLHDRGCQKDGLIHKISAAMWTAEDEEKFGLSWEKVICKQGDVRISKPHLPHGSTGPATCLRRTVLPWFVGIREDQETLDSPESGTWSELSACHRDFSSPEKTPSGWSSQKYGGRLAHPFSASIRLPESSPIGDALIGRERWDCPAVIEELDVLFGRNWQRAHRLIQEQRDRARRAYLLHFEMTMKAERQQFGAHSYFLRKEKGLSVSPNFVQYDGPTLGSLGDLALVSEDVGN